MGTRYCVGIDLGTTNSVIAYAPLTDDRSAGGERSEPSLQLLPIPQLIGPGQIESRLSLPSFLYLPREGEVESLKTPLVDDPAAGIAGSLRTAASRRRIRNALSWRPRVGSVTDVSDAPRRCCRGNRRRK